MADQTSTSGRPAGRSSEIAALNDWLSYAALEHAIIVSPAPMRIVVVCGVQGAGKSTWIASQPASQSRIYFDAALPAARHRQKLIRTAKELGAAVEAVWIDTPLDIAIERNAARTPDKIVPVTSIVAVAGQFDESTVAEGFDCIAVYKGG